ncbi:CapA family protein [Sphaerisporangium fuscum]|uniref:CapA family protein n=1 Tax=Sphaerisporangium fuscum TaxID=2835868 RepID=UPI001BDCE7F6|nr:CapA family protein [Sphaerisporangium fuscum]
MSGGGRLDHGADLVTLFLCGDVMLGRGVDQILPHPGDPELREFHIRDARAYVRLAEEVNGPIHRPVDFTWPWGDALAALDAAAPDVRVVNLETAITRSDDFVPGKPVHYRMNPDNLQALTAAHPDACVLANNHMLDFGPQGLIETLDSLAAAGLRGVGAGRDVGEAWRPLAVPLAGRRMLIFSIGMPSSGVPPEWAATRHRPGVAFVPEPSAAEAAEAAEVASFVRAVKRPGDVAVVSVHWGSNWGYEVSREQVRFAHALVDGGVDLVHGHSSHHPRPMEVYRGKLVMYGCGDFIDDYEGIQGYERYRDDLRLMYFAALDPETGDLTELTMTPMRARRMRLRHASADDSRWLQAVLDRISAPFGARVALEPGGTLTLRTT